MANSLHIVNGDNTAQLLSKSSIKGDVVVWREMLCEGPVIKDVGTDQFWKIRYKFYENELGIKKLDYFDRSIKEIIKLEDLKGYKEVVLWFEYDLFCQVNLMALCSYLINSYRKDIRYFLISTGKDDNKSELQSLADYSPESFDKLYRSKIKPNKNDLHFARKCWSVFVKKNLKEFQNYSFQTNAKFQYFEPTMNQQILRFPKENGFNQIQNKILDIIHSSESNKNEILKKMLLWQKNETIYGFGDMQYDLYLKKLEPYYFKDNNRLKLNKKGLEIISKIKV
jgi:hypothetical protein